jgi:outer membrane protein OmpA-like peptidoglycan-associated protein
MKTLMTIFAAGAISAVISADPALTGTAYAQTTDTQTIIDSLAPKPRTRSMTRSFSVQPQQEKEDEAFLETLPTRGIRIDQRKKLDEIVKQQELPSIDIEINFDYDSAEIRASSLADVDSLGKALTSDTLAGSRIVLNGHTDAAGSEQYNQDLSDRRAAAVREYLISNFGIAGDRLIAIGYGEERLKNTDYPLAGENRRVEVINLTKS